MTVATYIKSSIIMGFGISTFRTSVMIKFYIEIL